MNDKLKETLQVLKQGVPWRHINLGIGLILCFAYLFYDRRATYQTESGVVMAVVLVIGQIINYYAGSSKDLSDRDKVDQARKITDTKPPEP